MFLVINAICDSRRAPQEKSIKSIGFLNKILQIGMLFIFVSSVAACSGVPLVPGI
mgnify:CR=1 FL=1